MLLHTADFYKHMFGDMPKEIILLMGYDLMLASDLLVDKEKMAIYDMLKEDLEKGEILEVDFDWDKAMDCE